MPPLSPFQKKCLTLAIGQTLLAPGLSQAATITVNTTSDLVNAAGCTLREAIAITNLGSTIANGCNPVGSLGSNDEIDFNLANNSTIDLRQGMLEITSTVSVNGPGAELLSIHANRLSRALSINGASYTVIDNLNVSGGETINSYGDGGGINIVNSTSVTISNSTVSDNRAGFGAGIFIKDSPNTVLSNVISSNNIGGIIGSGGGVRIEDSNASRLESVTITDNISYYAGGIELRNSDDVVIVDSIINDNKATPDGSSAGYASGGGLRIIGSNNLIIENTTISGNASNGKGGGINVTSTTSSLIVNKSTISNNKASNGGGISISSNSSVSISNSTVSGNSVSEFTYYNGNYTLDAEGGGISVSRGGSVSIYNSTINSNEASGPNATIGGIYISNSSTPLPNLVNTVVANSISGDCNTVVNDVNNNWFDDNSCNGTASGDPLLGPLQDNGGLTFTHAPFSGSGLIDAGLLSTCQDSTTTNNVDQRNEPRGNSACFIGSVEAIGQPEETIFIIPTGNGKSVIFGL